MQQFQTRRDDFTKTRLAEADASPLLEGEVRVRVDRFGLSANNITYCVVGDELGYWQFFPPIGDDTEGWGVMPVWGYGDVSESKTPDVPVGERLFGYFPPAGELTLHPSRVSKGSVVDGSEHRAELPATYNAYQRVGEENADVENQRMLVWPLYATGFCLWETLQAADWYDAEQVVILSASSKTAIGLAYAIDEDDNSPNMVGLTSPRNHAFVRDLDLYQTVVTYDDIIAVPSRATVVVDMSGNSEVQRQLYEHLGDLFRYCVKVGLTHWEDAKTEDDAVAERSTFFFAPTHIERRAQTLGPAEFNRRLGAFVHRAAEKSRDWMKIRTLDGLAALPDAYDDVCAGRSNPSEGLIVQV